MAVPVKKYIIKKQHMKRGQISGFYEQEDLGLCLKEQEQEHKISVVRLDSAVTGCVWGRAVLIGEFPKSCTITLSFFASDDEYCSNPKKSSLVNTMDALLYEQAGRYLWLSLEVSGTGTGYLREIQVYTPGDTFMSTFPEIYRQHGSFFHRYMSIFSSIYLDVQQQIDRMHENLNPHTAPAAMLPLLGEWLGIRMEGIDLDEEDLREFLKRAWYFNKYKGTVPVISQITRLILKMDSIILERSKWNANISLKDREIINRLYGSSSNDITILAKGKGSERQRNQLLFLLEQFKPARCRIELVFLKENTSLDQYSYLDINSGICKREEGVLDQNLLSDGSSFLL